MRKTREEKGITLVALIITIIVLLILAVVAINAVTGDGIIQHATNAKTTYENAQAKENSMIGEYEAFLEKHTSNKKLISFVCKESIENPGYGTWTDTTCYLQAEEGMTWYEWCKSEYNTVNYICSDVNSEINKQNGTIERINTGGDPILGKEIIKSDTTYYMDYWF